MGPRTMINNSGLTIKDAIKDWGIYVAECSVLNGNFTFEKLEVTAWTTGSQPINYCETMISCKVDRLPSVHHDP